MSHRPCRFFGVLLIVVPLAAACGDDDSGTSADEGDDGSGSSTSAEAEPEAEPEPEPEAEPEAEPEPEAQPEPEPEPEATGSVTFGSLSGSQQHVVGGICQAVVDFETTQAFSYAPDWTLSVLNGESGVPALEEAFTEIGEVPDPGAYLEVVGPICEEIGWEPTG